MPLWPCNGRPVIPTQDAMDFPSLIKSRPLSCRPDGVRQRMWELTQRGAWK